METWKNQQIGKIILNGNSAMIDTEGIKNGGGIYQIAILIFNENGEEIKSKTWYIKGTISSNIQMHNTSNYNKDKGVYKKLLKIVNQKNV